MRRTLITVAAVMVVLAAVPAVLAGAGDGGDAILGLWATAPGTENGQAHVEIVRNGDVYSGRIVWLEKPTYPADDPGGMAGQARVDRNNPDAALRAKPIIGLTIVWDMVWDGGSGEWRKGRVYDPDNGKTYKAYLRLAPDGTLKLRGYIGISLLGRTSVWTRVAEAKGAATE